MFLQVNDFYHNFQKSYKQSLQYHQYQQYHPFLNHLKLTD